MYGRKEDMTPPLVKGGQGRSDAEVHENGLALTNLGVVTAIVLVVAIILIWLAGL